MNRLMSTVQLDMRLQFRNGLYYVGFGVALFLVLILRQLFDQATLTIALPVLLLVAAGGTGYIFAAGMLFLEKAQHTLAALNVSPLRPGEYMASKLISLSVLVGFEGAITVLLSYGLRLNWALLLLGLAAVMLFMVLVSMIVVVRYNSITDFLMPSTALIVLLQVPLLKLFDIGPAAFYYLFPSTPGLVLLEGAFRPLSGGELAYGLIGGVAAIAGAYLWARAAYDRYVIRGG
jgi:fluoroquinolone transport system permease protein